MTEKHIKVKDLHNKLMRSDFKYRKAYNDLENEYRLIKANIEEKENLNNHSSK